MIKKINNIFPFLTNSQRLILLLLFLWLYRQMFLVIRNSGGLVINKFVVLQIALGLLMLTILIMRKCFINIVLKIPVAREYTILYLFGCLSFFWSVFPMMSFYLALENIIIMYSMFYVALGYKSFYRLEADFIFFNLGVFFLYFLQCIFRHGGDFHNVVYATGAAAILVYCLCEYSAYRPPENKKILRIGMIGSGLFLILSTSSGANVSAAVAMFFVILLARNSRVRFLSILILCIGLVMYSSGYVDHLISILFPGKAMPAITGFHGRGTIWGQIMDKWELKPWLGWGHASVERIIDVYCVDAHNVFIGTLGSLGIIGCFLLIWAVGTHFLFCLNRISWNGFRGLLGVTVCLFVNSNTSSFIAAKINYSGYFFHMVVALTIVFAVRHSSPAFFYND